MIDALSGVRSKGGRPRKTPVGETQHQKRERFDRETALHVMLDVVPAVRTLRRPSARAAIQRALTRVTDRDGFRVVHLALAPRRMNFLIEAANHIVLAKGMQAFQISVAQYLNQAVSRETKTERKGQVFVDRYVARLLTTPDQRTAALSVFPRATPPDRYAFAWTPATTAPLRTAIAALGWRDDRGGD